MRAFTLLQPFASMVAGQIPGWLKSIETRTWPTSYRGPLLICAGKADWPCPRGYDGPPVPELPHGVAICVVDVVGCRRMRPADAEAACCDWHVGLWAWELANVRACTPFRVRGQQGIFGVEPPLAFWGEVGLDPSDHVVRGSLVHA